MRPAAQLRRGLAEAARSLERPYVPRHVPLPSSSYSATAHASAPPSPPRPAEADRKAADRVQRDLRDDPPVHAPVRDRSRPKDATAPSSQTSFHSRDTIKARGGPIPSIASLAPRVNKDSTGDRQSKWSVEQDVPRSIAANLQRNRREDGHAKRGGGVRSSQSGHASESGVQAKLKRLMAAYPVLSSAQARLVWQTFSRVRSYRSHPPQALIAWYEDHVWTLDRQKAGSERIESAPALCILLRYAYQRNDVRSVLRLEARALRSRWIVDDLRPTSAATAVPTNELGGSEVDGVAIWPAQREDPRRLAHNLKIALAARERNWIKVGELLDASGQQGKEGSAFDLDGVGWGSLLRFGLGGVEDLPKAPVEVPMVTEEPPPIRGKARQKARRSPAVQDPTRAEVSKEIGPEDEAAEERKLQAEAQVSLTKRLMPRLLQRTSSDGGKGEGLAPGWLLESVLIQLAARGQTAAVLRIVRLALAEAAPDEVVVRGGGTGLLNLALTACVQNRRVSLDETLRIFNALTCADLGTSIAGTTTSRPPMLDQGSEGVGREERVEPNEESLVLLLRKVTHPLFRASWSRRLLDDFQARWPKAMVAGRAFRIVLDTLASAPPKHAPTTPETWTKKVQTSGVGQVGRAQRKLIVRATLLERTLQDILLRFESQPHKLHRTSTNRFRFHRTLVNLRRLVKLKLATAQPHKIAQLTNIIHLIHRLQLIARKPPPRTSNPESEAL